MISSRRFAVGLAGILLLAALLRVLVFESTRSWLLITVPVLDAGFYHESAAGILRGTWPAGEPYFMGPLYSYILAGLYAIFGVDVTVVRLAQMVLGLVGVAMIGLIGRRLYGNGAGLIASALALLYGPFVYYEQIPLVATVMVVGTLVLFDRALALGEHDRIRDAVIVGLVTGALVALRGAALLYVVPIAIMLGRRRLLRPRSALLALGVVVVVAPFTAHNFRSGSHALLTTNLGWNLYVGNGADARGMFRYPNAWRGSSDMTGRAFASAETGRPLDPDETNRFWLDRTIRDLRSNPGRVPALLARKLYLAVQDHEIPQNESYEFFRMSVPVSRVAFIGWWLVLPFGVLGLLAPGRMRGAGAMTLGFALVPVVVCLIFFVTSRYRLPAAPFLIVLAGGGVMGAVRGAVSERGRLLRWGALSAAVLAAALVILPAPFNRNAALARQHADLGLRYQEMGALRTAEEQYRRAIMVHPGDGDVQNNLGTVLVRLERRADAESAYRAAARLMPRNPVPLRNLGTLLGQDGRDVEAEACFRRALELDPTDVATMVNLATSLALQSRWTEAIALYEAAFHRDPANPTVREMLISAREMADTLDDTGSNP